MVSPKLLVCDVDGTLLGADREISPAIRNAMAALKARAVPVALCTGRELAGARRYVEQLVLPGPHIFYDGALVAIIDGDVIASRPADRDVLRALISACRLLGIPLELSTMQGRFVEKLTSESKWLEQLLRTTTIVADLENVMAEQAILKAELISAAPAVREAIRGIEPEFVGKLRFSWAKVPGYDDYDVANVVHAMVSKGEALRSLAAYYSLPLEAVMAVGDGTNDIPLLTVAGLAIAMGNAPASVRAVAMAVTATVADDGLARAIEQYLLS